MNLIETIKNLYNLQEEKLALDEAKKFSKQQRDKAVKVIMDPRWKGGNVTKITNEIEKIARGLSKDKDIATLIKITNENVELDEIREPYAVVHVDTNKVIATSSDERDAKYAMNAPLNKKNKGKLKIVKTRKKQYVGDTLIEEDDNWDEDRMDVIGQNGNDGLHYDELDEKFKKGKYTVRDGNTGKVIATYNSGKAASREMYKLLDSGKYSELEVKMEEVELDEAISPGQILSVAKAINNKVRGTIGQSDKGRYVVRANGKRVVVGPSQSGEKISVGLTAFDKREKGDAVAFGVKRLQEEDSLGESVQKDIKKRIEQLSEEVIEETRLTWKNAKSVDDKASLLSDLDFGNSRGKKVGVAMMTKEFGRNWEKDLMNGRIDDDDIERMFKKIYPKMKNESIEESAEVNEISKKTLGRYVKKASADAAGAYTKQGSYQQASSRTTSKSEKERLRKKAKDALRRGTKRQAGIGKAVKRLTNSEEVIDEAHTKMSKALITAIYKGLSKVDGVALDLRKMSSLAQALKQNWKLLNGWVRELDKELKEELEALGFDLTEAVNAKEKGRLSFKFGRKPDQNPYPEGSDDAKDWSAGYSAAKAAEKKRDPRYRAEDVDVEKVILASEGLYEVFASGNEKDPMLFMTYEGKTIASGSKKEDMFTFGFRHESIHPNKRYQPAGMVHKTTDYTIMGFQNFVEAISFARRNNITED